VSEHVALNRARWDELVPIHARSPLYDLEHTQADLPRAWLDHGDLGEVTGKTLLHLQCHLGIEPSRGPATGQW
jgi:hypothetical protein